MGHVTHIPIFKTTMATTKKRGRPLGLTDFARKEREQTDKDM